MLEPERAPVTRGGPRSLPNLGKGVEGPSPPVARENRVVMWTTEDTAQSGIWE